MKRFSHLLGLSLLVAFWSLFYTGAKTFFWGVFESAPFHPTMTGSSNKG